MSVGAEPHAWLPGQVLLGKYQLIEQIGAGGMGAVHAAQRLSLGDIVAIKSILPERSNARNRARFLREARAVARVHHPNVVQVFDFGETEDGRPFMVMEYVEGPTLAQVLRAGPIPLARGLELFVDICKAVEAGHRRGVIHRDLKPGNVMLGRSDDGLEAVKVLDFGLAQLSEDSDELERSRAGALVGTCAYMSPESIEQGASGSAGDIFSLGVILYEVVTGVLPFSGANPIATILQICDGHYRPAQELVPGLPKAVSEAIDAALNPSVSARPGSALDLASRASGRLSLGARPSYAGSYAGLGGSQADTPSSPSSVSLASLSSSELLSRSSLAAARSRAKARGAGAVDGMLTEEVERPADIALHSARDPHDADTVVWDDEDELHDSARVRATLVSPPFVGRKLELDILLDLLAASARDDEVPIAVILGDPGMGRTRLLRRFAELARALEPAVFEGRFWSYDSDRAPAGETFLRMLGPTRAEPDEPDEPPSDRHSGFATLAKRFEAQARGRPLVLVLDDLHHAPSGDLEFLTYLVRGGQRAQPVVIVASARSEAGRSNAGTDLSRWLQQLAGLSARTTLSLSALDEEQIRTWLEGAFGRLRIRPRDLRRLEHASAGTPYVLSELLRHLVASGVIHRAEGEASWVCERLARDLLPEGVSSAVADQLTSLPEPLRKLLEVAAVIGERFRFELLSRAMGAGEEQLDGLVDDAVARGLLSEGQTKDPLQTGPDELRFRSATVQQVLYGLLGNRRRKRIHTAVIEALVALGHSGRHAKVLAYHYRAIGGWAKTLEWGLYAARQALAKHELDAAELALEHAAAAAETLDSVGEGGGEGLSVLDRLRLQALTGALDALIGRNVEGVARLHRARQLLDDPAVALEQASGHQGGQTRPLPYLRFEVALSLARCHVSLGQLDEAALIGREALDLALALTPAQAGGEVRRLAAEWDARVALAHALGRFGEWAPAIEVLEPVVSTTPGPGLRTLYALGLRERGWLAARSGDVGGAEHYLAQAQAKAKASGEPLAEYGAASLSAIVHSARGETAVAIRYAREALRRARSLSLRRREMIEQANLALFLTAHGEHDEALQNMLSVRAIARELGDIASTADARVGLGGILRARGDLDEAIESFSRGHADCEAVGRHEYAAIALLELGRCELQRGRWAAAQAVLQRARERFAELQSVHQWEVELALAQAARGLGEEDQALAWARAAEALLEHRRGPGASATLRDRVDRGLLTVREFISSSSA